jgi:hypothetical protein
VPASAPVVNLGSAARFSLPGLFRLRLFLGLAIVAAGLMLWPAGAFAGDPSFDDRQRFGSGLDRTQSIVAVDVDDDGDLDLAVGNVGQQMLQMGRLPPGGCPMHLPSLPWLRAMSMATPPPTSLP